MSRRRRAEKREVLPDPKFGDSVITKFMNSVMYAGKKSVAERIVYGALEVIESKAKGNPVEVFHEALSNVMPNLEVRSRRVVEQHIKYQWKCVLNDDKHLQFVG